MKRSQITGSPACEEREGSVVSQTRPRERETDKNETVEIPHGNDRLLYFRSPVRLLQ